MKWIDATPPGRLGFSNYKELSRFCEKHGIEIPVIRKRSWQAGVVVEERDWARLEREQGDKIKALREAEVEQYVRVVDIAKLFGMRRQYALRIAKGISKLSKIGRAYVVPRGQAKEIIHRIRERLETAHVNKRTRGFAARKAERDV